MLKLCLVVLLLLFFKILILFDNFLNLFLVLQRLFLTLKHLLHFLILKLSPFLFNTLLLLFVLFLHGFKFPLLTDPRVF